MTADRSAASVTLDTIIANALLPLVDAFGTLDAEEHAYYTRAVTDALLAKGRMHIIPGQTAYPHSLPDERGLFIPISLVSS